MRPQHNCRGNGVTGPTRDYRRVHSVLRALAKPLFGVLGPYASGAGYGSSQHIHPQCQTAPRVLPGGRALQDRSPNGGGSFYTITGPRSTAVKGLPRLSTRGRMPAAGPRSRITTWSLAWSMISPRANFNSIWRRRLSRHWK